jgi:hypothetical protein
MTLARILANNGPKTSVKDSTKFLGFLGGLMRQSIRCEDQTAQNLVTDFPLDEITLYFANNVIHLPSEY